MELSQAAGPFPGGVLPHAPRTLSMQDFWRFSELIYKLTGIKLTEAKYELLQARLASRLRALGLKDYGDYFDYVSKDQAGEELTNMVDQITTNKTEFFRESRHFDHLAGTAVPEALERGLPAEGFRLWCAAAATGEEPWTLAMTLTESLKGQAAFKVVATDISTKALKRAQEGVYETDKATGIPPALASKYFKREPGHLIAGDELRRSVVFARFNLMSTVIPFNKHFDCIFCRNVMIYFDRETQEALVNRMAGVLKSGGYLYTGLSESLLSIRHPLKSVAPSVYRKP